MLFDYYRGDIPEIKSGKPLYIFVSHFHKDHFNPKIFGYENAVFVLSKEISPVLENLRVTFVSPDNLYRLSEKISVRTFRSTDCGVAYLVFCGDKTIYHAGDLNLWLWETDTENEKEDMKRRFYNEIDKIKNFSVDLAFLSLDPRQKEFAPMGLIYFEEKVKPNKIFPMHFWGKYKYAAREITDGALSKISDRIIVPDKNENTYYV